MGIHLTYRDDRGDLCVKKNGYRNDRGDLCFEEDNIRSVEMPRCTKGIKDFVCIHCDNYYDEDPYKVMAHERFCSYNLKEDKNGDKEKKD